MLRIKVMAQPSRAKLPLCHHQYIAPTSVGAEILGRIAVDYLASVHGMEQAADFVFNLEQNLASFRMHNVLKTILMLIAFLRDQAVLTEELVGTGEVRHVNGNVMAVVV